MTSFLQSTADMPAFRNVFSSDLVA